MWSIFFIYWRFWDSYPEPLCLQLFTHLGQFQLYNSTNLWYITPLNMMNTKYYLYTNNSPS